VRTSTFRLPSLFLLVGFLGVVAGTIGSMVDYGVTLTMGTAFAEFLGAPIGYLLVGVAWWQWTPGALAGDIAAKSMRRASLTLMLAAVATSITYFGELYGYLRFRYSYPNVSYQAHFRLQLAAEAASAVGFVLAAVGFWVAARNLSKARLDPGQPEMAMANP
jgi:hypothetical protein